MKINLISIIVPAYHQEKTIKEDLLRILKVLENFRFKNELICVVDGSVDRTLERAQELTKEHKTLKVIGYEHNKGKGYAVRFGMAESKGDIIAFIDAGMELNPAGLYMLLEHFEWYHADIIIGSKRHPVSKVSYPWQRKVLSYFYQLLVRVLFGLKVKDTQVGMKFYRREVLEKVLPRLLVKTYAFDIEILAVANLLGFKRIYEAPVEIKLDFGGASTLTSKHFLSLIFKMLWDTLAIFYRLKILNYYSDKNQRKWRYDPELNFRVNIG